MTRTRRDPFPLFLQRLLIAESKERGVFSDSRRRSCGSCWNMVHNAAMEVRSGILTIRVKMWEILYMKARNCCVKIVLWLLCPVYGKFKRSVCCRNKTKYEEDSFSVFIQRLTSSTIASACTDVLSLWWRKATFQHTNLEDGSVIIMRNIVGMCFKKYQSFGDRWG